MKKGVIVVLIVSILFLSIGFVSANIFSDVWNKITGKGITGNVVAGDWCGYSDVNRDGQVSLLDYNAVKAKFGNAPCDNSNNYCDNADVTRDGQVGLSDYNVVKSNMGMAGCVGEHECNSNSDCGAINETVYCNAGSLCAQTMTPTCLSPAKMNSSCQNIQSTPQCSPCAYGCLNNACKAPSGEILPQSCTPSWSCGIWSACLNNKQTRTCTDSNGCGTTTGKPSITQSCGIPSQTCTPLWSCGEWSSCSNNAQTRDCVDANNCGVSTDKPLITLTCESNTPSDISCTEADINNDGKVTMDDVYTLQERYLTNQMDLSQAYMDLVKSKISSCGGLLSSQNVSCSDIDVNGDEQISLLDYNVIKTNFGKTNATQSEGDVNGDGQVGLLDFNILKAHYGEVCIVPTTVPSATYCVLTIGFGKGCVFNP